VPYFRAHLQTNANKWKHSLASVAPQQGVCEYDGLHSDAIAFAAIAQYHYYLLPWICGLASGGGSQG
jgi:hypothetical protein